MVFHVCLELGSRPWRHSEAMWPRLFTHHADVAWDDTHKDYTDLPPQVCHRMVYQEKAFGMSRVQSPCIKGHQTVPRPQL